MNRLFAAASFIAMAAGCDAATSPNSGPDEPAPVPRAGPACLVPSVAALDFGDQLTGTTRTLSVGYSACDGEPVTLHRFGLRDGTDFLLQARVLDVERGLEKIPTLPYTLTGNDELWLLVSYRAQASAWDEPVSRLLEVVADSRETPGLPGTASVELVGQPRTACPDDECGGRWPTTGRSGGAIGIVGPGWEQNEDPNLGQLGPLTPHINPPFPPGPPPSPW